MVSDHQGLRGRLHRRPVGICQCGCIAHLRTGRTRDPGLKGQGYFLACVQRGQVPGQCLGRRVVLGFRRTTAHVQEPLGQGVLDHEVLNHGGAVVAYDQGETHHAARWPHLWRDVQVQEQVGNLGYGESRRSCARRFRLGGSLVNWDSSGLHLRQDRSRVRGMWRRSHDHADRIEKHGENDEDVQRNAQPP